MNRKSTDSSPVRVLALGFYDDFARFFLSIKNELQLRDSKNDLYFMANNISGYLYWKFRDNNVASLFLLGRKYAKNYSDLKNKEYITCAIEYHRKEQDFNKTENKYRLRAVKYYNFYTKIINEWNPNFVIISGDCRISNSILKHICIQREIKHLFFEQGPFSTTMLDPIGVNAWASIRTSWQKESSDIVSPKDTEKVDQFISREKSIKYKRNPAYRVCDFLISSWPLRYIVPIDLQESGLFQHIFRNFKKERSPKVNSVRVDKNEVQIFLGLQVPDDANFRIHSPKFKNHYEILNYVLEHTPASGYKVIVREHPLFKGEYEKELYKLIDQDPRVELDQYSNAIQSYQKSDRIILNNSMMGAEFLLMNKPIILLGNSYYDQVVERIDNIDLGDFIINSAPIKIDSRIKFMKYFCFNYLLEGHYRDKDLLASKTVVDKVYAFLG